MYGIMLSFIGYYINFNYIFVYYHTINCLTLFIGYVTVCALHGHIATYCIGASTFEKHFYPRNNSTNAFHQDANDT